jgi:plasmid stability protein
MASITVKNIPDDLYERLRAAARIHHRSINNELIRCLETVLKPHPVSSEERLERLRRIRSSISDVSVTPEEIQRVIEDGRP